MGVGTPLDLIEGVKRGMDMFDCVLPTRLARHQSAQTLHGRLNLMNAKYTRDPQPIDAECQCYTCLHFSRAYLHHLIVAKEILAGTLISIHNLFTLVELMKRIRQEISKGTFDKFAQHIMPMMLEDS